MKTKTTKKTRKSLVQQMRDIRDKVNLDIRDLTPEELKEYIRKQKTMHPKAVWQNGG